MRFEEWQAVAGIVVGHGRRAVDTIQQRGCCLGDGCLGEEVGA